MTTLLGTHFGTYEVAAGGQSLRGFRHDPAPSPLGAGLLELAGHEVRVRAPMVRAGWLDHGPGGGRRGAEPFVPVDWDTALDLVAGELERVRRAHGNAAIFGGSYGWASAGRFHHAQSQLKRFLNLLGGFTYSVNSYSYGAAGVLLPHVLGALHAEPTVSAPSWDQITEHTGVMLAFGGLRPGNSQMEAGGVGRHTVLAWLGRAVARGMELIVVSPNRDDIPPGIAARHLPIRPNTDTALMLAMAQVLLEDGLVDHDFLARCTAGADRFLAYVSGAADGVAKTPDWAAPICGVPAGVIRDLAPRLCRERSLLNLSWSLQRAQHGEQPFWAAVALACLAGQIGLPGGGFAFGLGAVNSVGQPVHRLRAPPLAQGHNGVRHFIPVSRIADLLLRPGETIDYDGQRLTLPDIRLVYWSGGNPFHHHQDINRLRRAWQRPETVIVHEPVWTATARHADIVLPVTLPQERDDIAVSRDSWIIASARAAAPPAMARTDHAIFAALAERFGLRERFTEGLDERAWLRRMYEACRAQHPSLPDFTTFWDVGHAALDAEAEAPAPQRPLAGFVADPASHPLRTPSGRIELYSETIAAMGYADCPGHPAWLPPEEAPGTALAARYPLQLLSPQPAARLHSQLDAAGLSRTSKVAGREPLLMHPGDAAARGIAAGGVVRMFNDRGACLGGAVLTDALLPGVVLMATGAWYDPLDAGDPDTLDLHGNPNVVTPDFGTSRLSHGAAPNTCLVQVEAVRDAMPAPRAHLPPAERAR